MTARAYIFYVATVARWPAILELNYPGTRHRCERDRRSRGADGNVAPYIPRNALGSVREDCPNSGDLCFMQTTRVLYHNNATCPDTRARPRVSRDYILVYPMRPARGSEKCQYNTPLLKHCKTIFHRQHNLFRNLLLISLC